MRCPNGNKAHAFQILLLWLSMYFAQCVWCSTAHNDWCANNTHARTLTSTHTHTRLAASFAHNLCRLPTETKLREKNAIPYATSNVFGDCNEYIVSFATSSKCIFAFRVRRRWRTTQLMNVVKRPIQRLLNFSLNLVFFHLPSCQFSIDFSI